MGLECPPDPRPLRSHSLSLPPSLHCLEKQFSKTQSDGSLLVFFFFFSFLKKNRAVRTLRVFRSRNHFLPSSLPCSSRPSARLAGAGRGRRRANRFAGHILSELNEIHQGCHSHGRARRRQADMPTLCPMPPPRHHRKKSKLSENSEGPINLKRCFPAYKMPEIYFGGK